MDTLTCSVTWNGDVHEVQVPSPATAALVLEAFLGSRPEVRAQARLLRLALFTAGGTELDAHGQVQPGDDLILRPGAVH